MPAPFTIGEFLLITLVIGFGCYALGRLRGK